MNSTQGNRRYVVQALKASRAACPNKYLAMLLQTPVHRAIVGLVPWFFLSNPERTSHYCSESIGQKVLAFAQAVEEDMLACFLPNPSGEPEVLIINPWSESKAHIIQARLPNYDAWLDYAAEISRQVEAREAAEHEG